jgi:hypothetical protein
MNIARRAQSAFGPELICLLVTAVCSVGAALWLFLSLPSPRCNFRALFDIPCLTCGSTRAALALIRGDVIAAWNFNPLATTALTALALYNVYALAVLCTGAPPFRLTLILQRRWRVSLALLAAASLLNWLYLLHHG